VEKANLPVFCTPTDGRASRARDYRGSKVVIPLRPSVKAAMSFQLSLLGTPDSIRSLEPTVLLSASTPPNRDGSCGAL